MRMVMCLECGTFVKAHEDGGDHVPTQSACPECGETEFKDTESGRVITSRSE